MATFKYKRIKRYGRYYNSVQKDGKFFLYEKWDKLHHKYWAVERAKARRRVELKGRRRLPERGRPDKDLMEEIQFTREENAKPYEMLNQLVRHQISVDWSKVKSEETFNKLMDRVDISGKSTRKRRLAMQQILKVKFTSEKEVNIVAYFQKKSGRSQMRYRDKKGRWAER